MGSVSHIEVRNTRPASSMVTALSCHIAVDLHGSSIGIPDPVVAGRAACREFTAGGCRVSLGLERFTGNKCIAQQVLNILGYPISLNHECFVRRADLSSGIDDPGGKAVWEGGVVSLAGSRLPNQATATNSSARKITRISNLDIVHVQTVS